MRDNIIRIFIFFSFLFLLGCKSRNNEDMAKFTFNENSYLRFHIQNCKTEFNFILLYNTIFPYRQVKQNVVFDRDTVEVIRLTINHPVAVNFVTTRATARCYIIPNDTLDIWLDLDNPQKDFDKISFKGNTSPIADYLNKAKIYSSPVPQFKESVNSFNNRVDSLTDKALTALISYNKKERLPEWYLRLEEEEIQYSGAYDKISQFSQSYIWYSQYRPRPVDYVRKLKISDDNPQALISESYYNFLCWISPERYDTLLAPNNRTSDVYYRFIKDNLNYAQINLHSKVKDVFIAQRIGSFLSTKTIAAAISASDSSYFQKVDTLFNYARANLQDSTLYKVLLSYRNDQIKSAKDLESLLPGSKAPNFKMDDASGKSISLSNYKGHIIVLDFWTTWCTPCIKSIPEKNKLLQKYKKDGLVFLNICLDLNRDKWQKLIADNNFQGIHLICVGDWANYFYKSYYIRTVPHITLIGKKGEVIFNNVQSHNELESLIKKQL